jgi:hypothetical protein
LKIGRKRHRASLLNDGTVLVSGGTVLPNGQGEGDRTTKTAELFNPASETFSQVGDMSVARSDHDSVLLLDGTVLITGGTIGSFPGDVYNPSLQTFTPSANSMLDARGRLVSLRLKNAAWGSLQGQVLSIGGSDIGSSIFGGAQQALDSVEIYDPATRRFSFFGTMTVARQNHTATELQDGRVLITGGVGRPFVSGTAELVPGASPTPTPTPTPSPPVIRKQPKDAKVMAGQTATFSVVAIGTPPLLYQWKKNGVPITGASSSSYTTPPTTRQDNGSLYRVTVSNSGGSVDSRDAKLSVR